MGLLELKRMWRCCMAGLHCLIGVLQWRCVHWRTAAQLANSCLADKGAAGLINGTKLFISK